MKFYKGYVEDIAYSNFYRIQINIHFLKCYFYLYEIPGKDKF